MLFIFVTLCPEIHIEGEEAEKKFLIECLDSISQQKSEFSITLRKFMIIPRVFLLLPPPSGRSKPSTSKKDCGFYISHSVD